MNGEFLLPPFSRRKKWREYDIELLLIIEENKETPNIKTRKNKKDWTNQSFFIQYAHISKNRDVDFLVGI